MNSLHDLRGNRVRGDYVGTTCFVPVGGDGLRFWLCLSGRRGGRRGQLGSLLESGTVAWVSAVGIHLPSAQLFSCFVFPALL